MRIALPLIALVLATGAAPAPEPAWPILPTPMLQGPPRPGEAVCRDTIHEIREGRGLPELEDKEISADEPLFTVPDHGFAAFVRKGVAAPLDDEDLAVLHVRPPA